MRRTKEEREALDRAALDRATTGASANDALVVALFAARGLHVTPRVDVLTYNAWRAAGRQVRKGEKGTPVTVWIPVPSKDPKQPARTIPRTAHVFHVTQTDAIA